MSGLKRILQARMRFESKASISHRLQIPFLTDEPSPTLAARNDGIPLSCGFSPPDRRTPFPIQHCSTLPIIKIGELQKIFRRSFYPHLYPLSPMVISPMPSVSASEFFQGSRHGEIPGFFEGAMPAVKLIRSLIPHGKN